jgi:hypothetical protein
MLFAPPISQEELLVNDVERTALLRCLINCFEQAFPTIEYSIVPHFGILNAQASRVGSKLVVKLYGGLAFHKRMGADALAFALLHETGHHLAAGPRLHWNPWLACECISDIWATTEGMVHLVDQTGFSVDIAKALEELNHVIDHRNGSSGCQNCWALNWLDRKAAITKGFRLDSVECPLGRLIMRATSPGDEH